MKQELVSRDRSDLITATPVTAQLLTVKLVTASSTAQPLDALSPRSSSP
jgi:hypothetical protein